MTTARSRPDQVRDLIMLLILMIWVIYAGAAVTQLFLSGAKVLDSLPPFWFWGIPLAPYSALYTPWTRSGMGTSQPVEPSPPPPPSQPSESAP